jgi:hypothetical protein
VHFVGVFKQCKVITLTSSLTTLVKEGLHNNSPMRDSRTVCNHRTQYYEETKLNKNKTRNDLASGKPLTQHIIQITVKLQHVLLEAEEKHFTEFTIST